MVNVVGVRFKKAGKVYYFDPDKFDVKAGDNVIVETARGIEFGEVVIPMRQVEEDEIIAPLKKVMRMATEEDIKHAAENAKKEKEAFAICLQKIQNHNLEMKLIDVEYTFDNNKILFYFTADGRVDFRELVKDLASVFKTRIELRQIGVRDESKMMGGIGICGRMLCCSSYLGEFQPVSIKMAKEQGLSLNPTKISGACGRLMCCLKYEQDAYEQIIKKMPKAGAIVETPDGQGVVVEVYLIKEMLKVKLDKGNETDLLSYKLNEIKIVKDVREVSVNDEDDLDIEELKALED
jgi:cell fate regulator YaaT (PSP1 superfamily)